MIFTRLRSYTAAAFVVVAALSTACASSATPTPTATSVPAPIEAADITPILGTTALRLGSQRVAFILEGRSGLVTTPVVSVAVSGPAGSAEDQATATFHGWPFGTRGTYATDLTFDTPGEWLLEITGDQILGAASLSLHVTEESAVRDVGQLPPFSNTKTLEDAAGDLATISSHQRPDPNLYEVSVAEALFSGKPSVVVFASPAFCTSPTCGPQVDTLVELKDAHAGEAEFIHVEIYDNPADIQGDLTRAVLSPHVIAWGIDQTPDYHNESWTFVLGRDGRITQRFQGFATLAELEAALASASS